MQMNTFGANTFLGESTVVFFVVILNFYVFIIFQGIMEKAWCAKLGIRFFYLSN